MALVLLRAFDDPVEARVARATLEAHQIPAFLFEEHNPYPAYAMAPVRLMVPENCLEEATQLLETVTGAPE